MQAILMTEAMREKGWQTLLVTGEISPGEGSMEEVARERGLRPIKIETLSRQLSPARDLRSLWRLIRLFRRERPLIVHTHTAKAGTVGRLAAMAAGVPVRVHTFHGHVFDGYFSRRRTRIFLAIERFLARHTDAVIAVSPSQRNELVETYRIASPERVVTIPLGFDLGPFLRVETPEGSLRAAAGCSPEQPLVGWIGRLTAIKAPLLYLESASRLLTRLPATRFVMVGDGEMRGACEAQIRRAGVNDKICLPGWKQDLASVYADLDLLVLTSINEGTPLTLLEAMASARPFIAPDVGGVRDLMAGSTRALDGRRWQLFDNGILVPRSREPGQIADAVEYLLRRPELARRMGSAGREFVCTRYSFQRLAADLETLYLQLARKKKYLREDVCPSPSEPAIV